MKWAFLLLILAGVFAPLGFAQDENHIEVGAFTDYFHLSQTNTNFVGVGGRLGVHATSHWVMEAEMNYDFEQAFNETFNNGTTGLVGVYRSDVRMVHGLFGPTYETARGPIRFFLTAKGGFLNFNFTGAPANFNTFASSVSGLRSNNMNGTFYPGGGIEGHVGPVGLRLDVGDEMYFNNGTHHDLRVTFGPVLRF
jgi:hypothetical protein